MLPVKFILFGDRAGLLMQRLEFCMFRGKPLDLLMGLGQCFGVNLIGFGFMFEFRNRPAKHIHFLLKGSTLFIEVADFAFGLCLVRLILMAHLFVFLI